MTNELYFLDCLGFTILRNFHSSKLIDEINEIINNYLGKEKPVKFRILGTHEIFLDLMSNPKIMKLLSILLGDNFRFDHAFGRQQPTYRGDAANLHGGPYSDGYNIYAINGGKIFTSQIQVCHVLQEQKSTDGGLVFLPGSHKSNAFNNIKNNFGNDPIKGDELLEMIKNDFDSPYLMCPDLNAGDVILFTDALIHGCKPWKASHTRRNLYYSYMTGFISWKKNNSDIIKLARNDLERKLMRPAYIGDFEYDNIHLKPNEMKSGTLSKNKMGFL